MARKKTINALQQLSNISVKVFNFVFLTTMHTFQNLVTTLSLFKVELIKKKIKLLNKFEKISLKKLKISPINKN